MENIKLPKTIKAVFDALKKANGSILVKHRGKYWRAVVNLESVGAVQWCHCVKEDGFCIVSYARTEGHATFEKLL